MTNYIYAVVMVILQALLSLGVRSWALDVERYLRTQYGPGGAFPPLTHIAFRVVPMIWVIPAGLCAYCIGVAIARKPSAITHGLLVACILFMVILSAGFIGYTVPFIPFVPDTK